MNRNVLRKFLAAMLFAVCLGTTFTASAQKAALVQGYDGRAANIVFIEPPAISTGGILSLYTVPSGSVFVLEMVHFQAVEGALNTGREVGISSPMGTLMLFAIPTAVGLGSHVATYPVTVRYPPGKIITGSYWTSSNNPGDAVYVFFSGHLEPQ